jgi:hypothetical protein
VDVAADLPADAESAEPVQQRDTLLDHPPMYAQPRTVLNTAPGDDRPDPASPDLLSILVVVIAPVGVDRLRLPPWSSTPAVYRRDGLDQGHELGNVHAVLPRRQLPLTDPTSRGRSRKVLAPSAYPGETSERRSTITLDRYRDADPSLMSQGALHVHDHRLRRLLDRYADGVTEETAEDALKHAFGWTQSEGHGPGDELLGEPATVLELGSSRDNALPRRPLRELMASASTSQASNASRLGGDGATCPALGSCRARSCSSLPARMSSGTPCIRSEEPYGSPIPSSCCLWCTTGWCQMGALCSRTRRPCRVATASRASTRLGSQDGRSGRIAGAYEPATWVEILHRHGFRDVRAWHEVALDPDNIGTLIVEGQR